MDPCFIGIFKRWTDGHCRNRLGQSGIEHAIQLTWQATGPVGIFDQTGDFSRRGRIGLQIGKQRRLETSKIQLACEKIIQR